MHLEEAQKMCKIHDSPRDPDQQFGQNFICDDQIEDKITCPLNVDTTHNIFFSQNGLKNRQSRGYVEGRSIQQQHTSNHQLPMYITRHIMSGSPSGFRNHINTPFQNHLSTINHIQLSEKQAYTWSLKNFSFAFHQRKLSFNSVLN